MFFFALHSFRGFAVWLASLFAVVFFAVFAGNVSTVAGDGTEADSDGALSSAQFFDPQNIVVDTNGLIYTMDHASTPAIRVIDAVAGHVTTLATVTSGVALAFDAFGALFATDQVCTSVFCVACAHFGVFSQSQGRILMFQPGSSSAVVFAGSQPVSSAPADGPVASATFRLPTGIAVAPCDGSITISQSGSADNNLRNIGSNTFAQVFANVQATVGWPMASITFPVAAGAGTVTAFSSNTTVVASPSVSGSGTSQTLILSAPAAQGHATVTLSVQSCAAAVHSRSFTVVANLPPTTTSTADTWNTVGNRIFVSFTVGQGTGALSMSATSDNQNACPNSGLTFSGTGAVRTFESLAGSQAGTCNIAVTVSDSNAGTPATASTSFAITVWPCPTNCTACTDPNTCTLCTQPSVLFDGLCLNQCPAGTKQIGFVCEGQPFSH